MFWRHWLLSFTHLPRSSFTVVALCLVCLASISYAAIRTLLPSFCHCTCSACLMSSPPGPTSIPTCSLKICATIKLSLVFERKTSRATAFVRIRQIAICSKQNPIQLFSHSRFQIGFNLPNALSAQSLCCRHGKLELRSKVNTSQT